MVLEGDRVHARCVGQPDSRSTHPLTLCGTIAAKVRRFESPDEHPFTPETQLAKPILPPLNYPRLLYPNNVNVTSKIKDFYINAIIPAITRRATQGLGKETDDGNYGSCATRDITALEAMSRRIHYGKTLLRNAISLLTVCRARRDVRLRKQVPVSASRLHPAYTRPERGRTGRFDHKAGCGSCTARPTGEESLFLRAGVGRRWQPSPHDWQAAQDRCR